MDSIREDVLLQTETWRQSGLDRDIPYRQSGERFRAEKQPSEQLLVISSSHPLDVMPNTASFVDIPWSLERQSAPTFEALEVGQSLGEERWLEEAVRAILAVLADPDGKQWIYLCYYKTSLF
jgi:hypothetical protein